MMIRSHSRRISYVISLHREGPCATQATECAIFAVLMLEFLQAIIPYSIECLQSTCALLAAQLWQQACAAVRGEVDMHQSSFREGMKRFTRSRMWGAE